jgi:hypothetical protein
MQLAMSMSGFRASASPKPRNGALRRGVARDCSTSSRARAGATRTIIPRSHSSKRLDIILRDISLSPRRSNADRRRRAQRSCEAKVDIVRQYTNAGVRLALDRVRGARSHNSVEDFLRHPSGAAGTPVAIPNFVRLIASAFLDAHSKRNDADYDLNEALSEADAWLLADRVEGAIENWRQAAIASDRDLKHALCTVMLLGGKLRSED